MTDIERAEWLADKLHNGGDYGKEAAALLVKQAATIAALKETLHNELDGNLQLRELGGARTDEDMTTFLKRVFAERDSSGWRLAAWVEKDGELVWRDRESATGRNLYLKGPNP